MYGELNSISSMGSGQDSNPGLSVHQAPGAYLPISNMGMFTLLKVTCEHSQVEMFQSVPKSKLFVH